MAPFFTFNTGSFLPGTSQIGNLAIADNPSNYPGHTWWANAYGASRYILARQVPSRPANALIPGATVNFGFLGSDNKSDASYLALVNSISGQNFTVVQDATNWCNENGYWSSQGSSNATDIITDGLVLQVDASNNSSYPGTGTTWYDLSGNGYDGTLISGSSYSSSYGGVITFDGSLSQSVTFGDPVETRLTSSNAVTYQVWVRTTGFTNLSGQACVWNKATSELNGILLQMNFPGSEPNPPEGISCAIYNDPYDDSMSAYYSATGASPATGTHMTTGSWYFVTATAQLDATIGTLYNNNQLYDSQTQPLNQVPNFENTASLELGKLTNGYYDPGFGNSWFTGEIGAFYVYNRQLSQAEVTSNFNVTKARYGY